MFTCEDYIALIPHIGLSKRGIRHIRDVRKFSKTHYLKTFTMHQAVYVCLCVCVCVCEREREREIIHAQMLP